MRHKLFTIIALVLVAALALAGCKPDVGGQLSARKVRMVGTAKAVGASKALSGEPAGFVIDSVDSVIVDGVDIKPLLKPVGEVADGQNNVTFSAEVSVPENVTFSAEAKVGYVFDEWEVLDDEEAAGVDEDLLDRVEDWLEDKRLEREETINVPAEYIQYLVAEYDHGFYVDLGAAASDGNDGTKAHPFAVSELVARLETYNEDELTLVLTGNDAEAFGTLVAALGGKHLEEVKIRSNNIALDKLPEIAGLEELSLSGFTFTAEIVVDAADAEYKFEDCHFNFGFKAVSAAELEMLGCFFKNVVVQAVGEIEIKGGGAEGFSVEASTLEEFELELKRFNVEEGTIDLSKIAAGEVELKDVLYNDLIRPGSGVHFEEKPAK